MSPHGFKAISIVPSCPGRLRGQTSRLRVLPVSSPGREAASLQNSLPAHFGLEDAARKWCELSQDPGLWAGVVSHSMAGEPVYKLVTQVRWGMCWPRNRAFLIKGCCWGGPSGVTSGYHGPLWKLPGASSLFGGSCTVSQSQSQAICCQ
jgi:hypothetical protein